MPICNGCKDEVDKLVSVKVGGKARKLCEDCADRAREEDEIGAPQRKSDRYDRPLRRQM